MEDELEKRFKEIGETNKSRLDEAEKNFRTHLEHHEKRIGDAQKYPTVIVAALTALIIGISLFSALNLDRQIDRIESTRKEMLDEIDKARNELKNEIRVAFEKGTKMADIILLSDVDERLEGQTLTANILPATKEGQKFKVEFAIIVKNQGKGASDPLFIKTYTTDDLPVGGKSSDEKDFTYESYLPPEKLPFESGILPAGLSASFKAGFNIKNYNDNLDQFPILIKVYFGGDSPAKSMFSLYIPKQRG
jgi:hypothetical protein